MKKFISDFRIVSNEALTSRLFLMKLTPANGEQIAAARPGQFAEIRVDGESKVFLRRPISIHRILSEKNELWLLVQKAGNGTNHLATMKAGEVLNIVYPLGNGFSVPAASATPQKVLLIGGGVGIAPLLETGAVLKSQGCEVTYLLGGRTAADLVEVEEYRAIGNVLVTTEDGSTIEGLDCQKGFVTNHTQLQSGLYNYVKVCGPGPMMKAVVHAVADWQEMKQVERFLEVSLENKMACGLGVCLCCVEDTQEGHKCVCSDGPVFDVKDLKW